MWSHLFTWQENTLVRLSSLSLSLILIFGSSFPRMFPSLPCWPNLISVDLTTYKVEGYSRRARNGSRIIPLETSVFAFPDILELVVALEKTWCPFEKSVKKICSISSNACLLKMKLFKHGVGRFQSGGIEYLIRLSCQNRDYKKHTLCEDHWWHVCAQRNWI